MTDPAFASLENELRLRAARATVSTLRLANPWLRNRLLDRFQSTCGQPGSFMGEPVFEALFEYERSDRPLADS